MHYDDEEYVPLVFSFEQTLACCIIAGILGFGAGYSKGNVAGMESLQKTPSYQKFLKKNEYQLYLPKRS